MNQRDLPDQTIAELAVRVRDKEVSPVELTAAILSRIERLNPSLNAYITVVAEEAIAAAHRAEEEIASGHYRGPLHGIPIAHKDVISTRGIRTTAHSRVLLDHVPERSATVVLQLERAGAIMLGKTSTHEFACGGTPIFGLPLNPWSPGHVTGGSSAGSAAAVSAGLCVAATGSDTAGSIRVPAAFCGVVGYKPTYGLVSRDGVTPVSQSLDHVGPLTRSVHDAALMLASMTGHHPTDPESPACAYFRDRVDSVEMHSISGKRIGLPVGFFEAPVQPSVAARVHDACGILEGLGVELIDVRLDTAASTLVALQAVMWREATSCHLPWLRTRLADYGPDARTTVLMGAFISGTEYLLGQQLRQRILSELNDLWERVDALVWPTTFRTAFEVGAPQTFAGQQTRLTNLTGTPSLSLPCGFDDVGLPVGIQINGRAHDDHLVLSMGAALERATEHHDALPSVTEVMPPLPPDLRFAPPTAPAGVGTLELAALEDDIRRGLARLDVGLIEEDLSVFVYRLHEFRRNLREAVPGLQSRR